MAPIRRIILAGLIGNIIEWYDFAIFGYMTPIMAAAFFPAADPLSSLIGAMGAFAAGFVARPLGGAVFGWIGDSLGRRVALIASILAMVVPTILVGLLPTHAALGLAAPVILILLRLIQGLAAGGEFTTSVVFLVEHAPPGRRGRVAAWAVTGATIGALLGGVVGTAVDWALTDAQMAEWGWRLPFLISLPIALAGAWLRRRLPVDAPPHTPAPLIRALRHHGGAVARVIGLYMGGAVASYLMFSHVLGPLVDHGVLDRRTAMTDSTLALAVMVVLLPVGGWLADRFGGRRVMALAALGLALAAPPLMWVMDQHSVLAGQIGLVVPTALLVGASPATLAACFPPAVRCSALAAGYNLCVALFGGTAPLVDAWLTRQTGSDIAVAFWLMAAAGISAVVAARSLGRREWL